MAEPFVFHFRRGADGTPEQMYLADIRAECGLCGHPQVQRYYHATPLHPVTTERLVSLAETVLLKTDYDCPNCGTDVGPDDARDAAFTWAFPDDAGLIRGFLPDAAERVLWQLVPGRRLDPQELPGWEPEEHPDRPISDELSDDWIAEHLDRPVNPKLDVVGILDDWHDDPEGGTIARIAPGMWLVAGDDPADLVAEVRAEVEARLIEIRLDDCVPDGLPTHREPARMAGALDTWLPGRLAALAVDVRFLVDVEVVRKNLHRAFDVANLSYEETDDVLGAITTPRDEAYPRDVALLAVARRAVYTGLTPGDAARLTAEEIVGTLLRVW